MTIFPDLGHAQIICGGVETGETFYDVGKIARETIEKNAFFFTISQKQAREPP